MKHPVMVAGRAPLETEVRDALPCADPIRGAAVKEPASVIPLPDKRLQLSEQVHAEPKRLNRH
jgi:hypothetical protein